MKRKLNCSPYFTDYSCILVFPMKFGWKFQNTVPYTKHSFHHRLFYRGQILNIYKSLFKLLFLFTKIIFRIFKNNVCCLTSLSVQTERSAWLTKNLSLILTRPSFTAIFQSLIIRTTKYTKTNFPYRKKINSKFIIMETMYVIRRKSSVPNKKKWINK